MITMCIEHTVLYVCALTLSHSLLRKNLLLTFLNLQSFSLYFAEAQNPRSVQSTEELPQNPHFQLKYICFIFHIVALAVHPLVPFV